ncbi:MAG: GNAT family N-acetyltransferase [Clostridiaceae bacterium]|nr:GNAT family N-acetyltransferase [Clostridiaceae bacterium]
MDDVILLDEIYIEKNYSNKGLDTKLIKNVILNNDIIYLWVYKENGKAISLYKKLGFNTIEETETRLFIAKNIYQKREERKNKPEKVVDTNKTNIN